MTLQLVNIAGALRNTGTGWVLLNNSGHMPEHLSSVEDADTALKVNFDQTFYRVGSIIIAPDETFAPLYTAGASVGLSYFNLFMYDRNGSIVPPANLISPNGNWWVDGTMWRNV